MLKSCYFYYILCHRCNIEHSLVSSNKHIESKYRYSKIKEDFSLLSFCNSYLFLQHFLVRCISLTFHVLRLTFQSFCCFLNKDMRRDPHPMISLNSDTGQSLDRLGQPSFTSVLFLHVVLRTTVDTLGMEYPEISSLKELRFCSCPSQGIRHVEIGRDWLGQLGCVPVSSRSRLFYKAFPVGHAAPEVPNPR